MAVSYAQMNKKVLLIDADMRNSSMKEFLQDAQWNDTDGLSEYLAEIADKPAKIAFEKNLDIIPSGTMPPNPSELLVSERWYQLLQGQPEGNMMPFSLISVPWYRIGCTLSGTGRNHICTGHPRESDQNRGESK